ncbi:hypothetical protein LX15_001868 [Streptoalloteichus tenebrarius]|uniref:Pyridoxamine 5'-phosphate oxidase N-terminal domain-containing protein n=1 Tax=Streptoalloteichus tenebrarius (strain ATCC 17920 / DSM 40477 / JCM 4838 / CBS 697.72 / NBRC 16177 / NCIMB 11028 / NRRL B-12390 / A12253. 1 / ISP 5477) TaxID=1933 RepID=A0ABT1HRM2_STRSD|nr:pyridoxamine 5'-phosphate oxidase family protein [Streptoalloteichus tenebrarius]MCP2258174.1 hypothetical protein [Streptoalloteichus tenebrarius]BFF04600.1 pyridoxamine 5'-phosphate oxidase family protein [Streptoalloteichus tenebrarius]
MTTGSFADLRDDFLRLTTEIAWCTVATVDRLGRPRTRILHPIWEVPGGQPVGWVLTTKTPVKAAHVAANPYVSCSYWSPAHDTVFVDCRASWVEEVEVKQRVWDMFREAPQPLGYDPGQTLSMAVDDPALVLLRLDPWRVHVRVFADLTTRSSGRIWRSSRS